MSEPRKVKPPPEIAAIMRKLNPWEWRKFYLFVLEMAVATQADNRSIEFDLSEE